MRQSRSTTRSFNDYIGVLWEKTRGRRTQGTCKSHKALSMSFRNADILPKGSTGIEKKIQDKINKEKQLKFKSPDIPQRQTRKKSSITFKNRLGRTKKSNASSIVDIRIDEIDQIKKKPVPKRTVVCPLVEDTNESLTSFLSLNQPSSYKAINSNEKLRMSQLKQKAKSKNYDSLNKLSSNLSETVYHFGSIKGASEF